MTTPTLVTVPDVELMRVGTFDCATGGAQTFTPSDIAAAVKASTDPDLRAPIVRIGHDDPRFDGSPAFGRVRNLRASLDGQTLIGDLVDMPAQLASIMRSAYPSRSIEALRHVVTASGAQHPFALTGLALLGATPPAIESLADIAALYGIAAAGQVTSAQQVQAVLSEPLAASPQDVQPLYRLPDRTVPVAAGGTTPKEAGMPDLLTSLRKSLGLAEDADEATIQAALDARLTTPPAPIEVPAAPVAVEPPAGYVVVPEERLQALEVAASKGVAAAETQRIATRDAYLNEAVKAGKLIPARRDHFAGLYDLDEQGTRAFFDGVKAGAAVPLTEHGHSTDPIVSDDDTFANAWHAGASYATTTTKEA